ncbi:hypothetical protein LFE_2324 [Leptospirillum ferrooxidans C2-3]|uniref:Uncharacterized protein n=1 Tax=Leptospirillum ferrooxidans (strain C2-3) TaxID=1162668 RepID=I0IRU7_LEPFC|nr:hypothetical protein LFE_2324 [Leptospirillum ferrooxidans C2-3]
MNETLGEKKDGDERRDRYEDQDREEKSPKDRFFGDSGGACFQVLVQGFVLMD